MRKQESLSTILNLLTNVIVTLSLVFILVHTSNAAPLDNGDPTGAQNTISENPEADVFSFRIVFDRVNGSLARGGGEATEDGLRVQELILNILESNGATGIPGLNGSHELQDVASFDFTYPEFVDAMGAFGTRLDVNYEAYTMRHKKKGLPPPDREDVPDHMLDYPYETMLRLVLENSSMSDTASGSAEFTEEEVMAALAPLEGQPIPTERGQPSEFVLVSIDEEVFGEVMMPIEPVLSNLTVVCPEGTYCPDDALFGDQWGLFNTGQANGMPDADIHAVGAWNVSASAAQPNLGDRNVVIAIVDTGVFYDHPDLQANIFLNQAELRVSSGNTFPPGLDANGDDYVTASELAAFLGTGKLKDVLSSSLFMNEFDEDGNGWLNDILGYDFVMPHADCDPSDDCSPADFDPDDWAGHGSHVAGIAVASADESYGIVGACPSCSIMPVRAGYRRSNGTQGFWSGEVASAIQYATINGANVINMSFGFAEAVNQTELQQAYDWGVILTASAMNNGNSEKRWPAAYEMGVDGTNFEVLGVAAIDRTGNRAVWNGVSSNFGLWVDLAAPGKEITSTFSRRPIGNPPAVPEHFVSSGTSMASPHIAGAAGLILSNSALFAMEMTAERAEAVINLLLDGASPFDNEVFPIPPSNQPLGEGVVSARGAFDLLPPPSVEGFMAELLESPRRVHLTWQANWYNVDGYTVTRTGGNQNVSFSVAAGTTAYEDLSLFVQGATYVYKIAAHNGIGTSSYTDPVLVMIPAASPGCFLAGTLINLADGSYKPIEQIKVGDRVLSYDLEEKVLKTSVVRQTFAHPARKGSYRLINGIRVTNNHPMYIDGQFRNADKVKKGDRLLRQDGSSVPIISVETQNGTRAVYNFEVAGTHTYFAKDLLGHNLNPAVSTHETSDDSKDVGGDDGLMMVPKNPPHTKDHSLY